MSIYKHVDSDMMSQWLYGTAWKEEKTSQLTLLALQQGFRAIDTANQRKHYLEADVGEALQEFYKTTDAKREDIFLQTKFTYSSGQDHRLAYDLNASFSTQVEQSVVSSLNHLQTDYIDSYLLHGPYNAYGIADVDLEVWETMERLHRKGYLKQIGVSNVSEEQLLELYSKVSIKPTIVQNRCYAHTAWDMNVRNRCKKLKIEYQGFSLLSANLRLTKNIEFKNIVNRTKLTPAQVIYQTALQLNIKPLTGTTNIIHMHENTHCMTNKLSAEDVNLLEIICYT